MKSKLLIVLVGILSLAVGFGTAYVATSFVRFESKTPGLASIEGTSSVEPDELSVVATHKKSLVSTAPIAMPSGDKICLYGSFPTYVYKGDACEQYEAKGIRIIAGQHYAFRNDDREYVVSSGDCETSPPQNTDNSVVESKGCEIIIETKKYDVTKKDSVTKEFVLGDGMEVRYKDDAGSQGAKMINPVVNAEPLVGLLTYDEYSDFSGFKFLWISNRCGNAKICTFFEGDGEEARSLPTKLGIATPRGEAKFDFSVDDIHDKKSKTLDLQDAKVTLAVKDVYYEKCDLSYCEEPVEAWGELLNRAKFSISYTEK